MIGLDHDAWMQLPAHPSAIWRSVARDAKPLLAEPCLNDLVQRLGDNGLSTMAIHSRYPLDATQQG